MRRFKFTSHIGADIFAAVVAITIATIATTPTAWAKPPLKTPGTPPGITLPPATEAVPAPPAWEGVAFKGGVVSVSHPLAAKAGADVLANGGNAIDAAAAIQFVLWHWWWWFHDGAFG
jgi:gamma-glutamyltranspeptidase / glutathione hydrolase